MISFYHTADNPPHVHEGCLSHCTKGLVSPRPMSESAACLRHRLAAFVPSDCQASGGHGCQVCAAPHAVCVWMAASSVLRHCHFRKVGRGWSKIWKWLVVRCSIWICQLSLLCTSSAWTCRQPVPSSRQNHLCSDFSVGASSGKEIA